MILIFQVEYSKGIRNKLSDVLERSGEDFGGEEENVGIFVFPGIGGQAGLVRAAARKKFFF